MAINGVHRYLCCSLCEIAISQRIPRSESHLCNAHFSVSVPMVNDRAHCHFVSSLCEVLRVCIAKDLARSTDFAALGWIQLFKDMSRAGLEVD
jgi:hypothetical protein